MQDRNKEFQNSPLELEWFQENCLAGVDPIKAWKKWNKWLSKRDWPADTKYKKALQLATGFNEAVIRQYVTKIKGEGQPKLISERRLRALAYIDRSLDITLPETLKELVGKPPIRKNSELALLIDMNRIVSQSYYMEVIKSLVEKAMEHHLCINIYSVSQDNHELMVKRISHIYYPSGFIMVRLNPSDKCCATLANDNVPAVLIHADKKTYNSPPVLANIVPDQSKIQSDINQWLKDLQKRTSTWKEKHDNTIVIVTMPPEPNDSVRTERINIITKSIFDVLEKVLKNVSEDVSVSDYIQTCYVEDYSFRHAIEIYQKYPNAMAYICLSDEIAVGLKHLMEIDGKDDYGFRVIGFDNSRLADLEKIASFNQKLNQIGESVVATFLDWFESFSWPNVPKEILLEVNLVNQNDRIL